jgi:hypothetical protein
MAQPLYFLPGLREQQFGSIGQVRLILGERGLTDVFSDVPHDKMGIAELTGRGPGDKSGVILAYQRPDGQIPRRLGYYPKEQVWQPVADGKELWIGLDPSEPPTPADLMRRRVYSGYELELAAAFGQPQAWTIPIVRRPDGSTELPTDVHWDATGQLVQPIKPAYAKYWEATAEVLTWWQREFAQVPLDAALRLAIAALSINYRFGVIEHNFLRVLDSDNLFLVLALTIDGPNAGRIAESHKKKDDSPSTSSSGPGSPDSIPVTDPPAASSGSPPDSNAEA